MNARVGLMWRIAVAACWLFCGSTTALAADADLDAIAARIGTVEVLRGGFEQEKEVAGFRNPLRSRGDFVMSRGHGVIWNTRAPFPSELVVTGERILSRQSDGRLRIELDGQGQPALAVANAMLLALVSGDVQALSAHFDIEAQVSGDADWQMRLTPRGAALAKAFAAIALSGDRHVREVEIVEAGGDRTRLRFADLVETPARLSADEAARFD